MDRLRTFVWPLHASHRVYPLDPELAQFPEMHDRVFVGGGLSKMAAAFFNKQRDLLKYEIREEIIKTYELASV